MNILFINSIGKDKYGGGEKWMVKAAAGLRARGNAVTIASRRHAQILEAARRAGVPAVELPIHADVSPIATWRIARYLKAHAIDILICNLNKDIRVAGLAAKLVGTPLVLHRHGVGLCGKSWKHRLTMTKLTDGIITNSESIKSLYLSYGWFHDSSFIKVIYNGVETKSGVVPHDFAPRFGDRKVILAAGRLGPEKGFSHLIDAMGLLRSKRSDVACVIAGRGRLEQELRSQISRFGVSDCVHLAGYVPDLDPWIAGCDIFVLSSLWEGMPNVVMESMALAKPVVATRVNGVTELVEDGVCATVVEPARPDQLAQALDELLKDPAKMRRYGENGRRRVTERFTMDAMIDKLQEYLAEELARRTGGRRAAHR